MEELCNLRKFIEPLKKYFEKDTIVNYYNIIHQKGINLIKTEQLNIEEILNFIYNQDIYYYDNKYIKHEFRDPSVFIYIQITDEFIDYLSNIELLKEKKIWELFNKSGKEVLNQFFQIFVDKMLKVKDLIDLLNLFPESEINKDFTTLINDKIITTIFSDDGYNNQKNNKYFELFENILILNFKNKLDLIEPIKLVQISLPYQFTSNYFFFLLQSKKITKNNSKNKTIYN